MRKSSDFDLKLRHKTITRTTCVFLTKHWLGQRSKVKVFSYYTIRPTANLIQTVKLTTVHRETETLGHLR